MQNTSGQESLLIVRDSATHAIIRNEHRLNGELHRDPTMGPAFIERHPVTGGITIEQYWLNGEPHRDPAMGPAFIERHPVTGDITFEQYWLNGRAIPAPAHPSVMRAAHLAEAARPANG